ncbi:MAG: hypothetical protein ACREA4_08245, partial [Nitrososphaera sp.]
SAGTGRHQPSKTHAACTRGSAAFDTKLPATGVSKLLTHSALFYCQLMYWWVIHSSLMKIVLDVFYVKAFIKASEKLAWWQVFIKQ